jgi:hypothetical protein
MITYRVHGYWLGPIVTVWTTSTEEEFEKYCQEQGFVKDDKGVYREGKSWLEIK